MATWKGTTLSILPLTITRERNIYEGLAPSSVRESAPNMTSGGAIGKTQGKARKQSMHVSALSYNGTKHVLSVRTTPTEIGVSLREKSAAMIGPVQEIRKPTLQPASLFGAWPFAAPDRFKSALQEPDNESHRMNLTTAQALHGGNCPNGCP
jgi:hypothetical protein